MIADYSNRESIYRDILGDEGMELYKLTFDRNNNERVRKFHEDAFIRKIWPIFLVRSQFDKHFKENESLNFLNRSFCSLTA